MSITHILTNLKNERDFILSKPYVPRSMQSELARSLGSELIKVITGPRRSGKSTMGLNTLKEFGDFFYINFDSEEVQGIGDFFNFIETYHHLFSQGKVLFLDEIQNVPKYELLVTQLQRNGYNVIMTGSNANLLSRDLATHLTGRYTATETLPFSYSEAQQLIADLTFVEYLQLGGFPEQLRSKGSIEQYLQTVFEGVILKDIVVRYGIRNVADLLNVAKYLSMTPAGESSFRKITQKLNLASVTTVTEYYGYLEEAYLVFKLGIFSYKSADILKSGFKTYLVDTGLFAVNSNQFAINQGHLFENAVFLELVRRGFRPNIELFQHANKDDTKVDFYTQKNSEHTYIQVCLSIKDNSTREREFRALHTAMTQQQGKALVIVLDPLEADFSTQQVQVVGITDWLE